MPGFIVPLIGGLLAGGGGGGGSSSANTNPNNPYAGNKGKGIIQPMVVGAMEKRWIEKEAKRKKEQAEQDNLAGMFNYDRQTDRQDLTEDVALENYGELASDYLSPELVTGPGADRYGGALETLMGMSQGYNPTMAYNPFLGEYGTTQEATKGLRAQAEGATAEGVDRWESALQSIGEEYDAGRTQLRGDVDAREAEYRGLIESDRAERGEDEANLMLEQWSKSGRSHERQSKAAIIDSLRAEGKSPSEILAWVQAADAKGLGNTDMFDHGLAAYR